MVTGVFLGPVCDYVIAPVARYAGVWGIPVVTAGGQADAFHHKVTGQYPSLTRLMGSYSAVGQALKSILKEFGWSVAGLLYHNHGVGSGKLDFCVILIYWVFHSVINAMFKRSNIIVMHDAPSFLTFIYNVI
jgi:atrial natriuretic peptide receptor A